MEPCGGASCFASRRNVSSSSLGQPGRWHSALPTPLSLSCPGVASRALGLVLQWTWKLVGTRPTLQPPTQLCPRGQALPGSQGSCWSSATNPASVSFLILAVFLLHSLSGVGGLAEVDRLNSWAVLQPYAHQQPWRRATSARQGLSGTFHKATRSLKSSDLSDLSPLDA